jgi:hypothetical protein
MHCVSCGQSSRFNRAVQYPEDGLVGTLCTACERRTYDRPLAEMTAERDECLVRGRPVAVALPEHRLLVDGCEDVAVGGYFLSAGTPRVCERHAPVGLSREGPPPTHEYPPVPGGE